MNITLLKKPLIFLAFFAISIPVVVISNQKKLTNTDAAPQFFDAYNAEGWGNNPTASSSGSGWEGNGFMKDLNDHENCGVTFHNVSVTQDGCYPLKVKYCTEGNSDSTLIVVVNNTSTSTERSYGAVDCSVKSSWDNFVNEAVYTTYINLLAGSTYDIVIKGGAGYAQLDSITLEDRIGDSMTRYEAENASRDSGVNITESLYRASNGHAVGDITESAGVTYNLNFASATTSKMFVCMCAGSEQNNPALDAYVDGVKAATLNCIRKTGWGVFDNSPVASFEYNFTAGDHTIKFVKSAGAGYAQLDYIDVFNTPVKGTRYELENFETTGEILSSGSGFSGTGYVASLDMMYYDYVSANVSVAEDGEYDLTLGYTNGGSKRPVFGVYVNGEYYNSLACATGGSWGVFTPSQTVTCKVSLKEGNSIIKLIKGPGEHSVEGGNPVYGFAQLDYIDISEKKGIYKSPIEMKPNLPSGSTRYEAEDAYVINAERKDKAYSSTCSGFGFVGGFEMGGSSYGYLEFNVEVKEDGTYPVTFCYGYNPNQVSTATFNVAAGQHGRGKKVYYYANNLSCASTADGDWGKFTNDNKKTVNVGLKSGKNFIVLRLTAGYSDIDYLDVGAKSGAFIEGTLTQDYR